ncbi:MAG: hypothetical protein EA364_05100 [Balneolaceae bacterium]|nr:MAG: hypothetical protein EA364_05100 [Balneolaceae bacterium]
MIRVPIYLLLFLTLVSCNIINSENAGELSIELNPQQVQIDEDPTLLIKNLTTSTIRYHCGYDVEVLKNGDWETATQTGCANSFPYPIEPKDSYSISLSLFSEEAGTYRVIILISIKDGDEWDLEKRATNAIKVIE